MGKQERITGSQSIIHFPGRAEVGGEPCLRLWLILGTSFFPWGQEALGRGDCKVPRGSFLPPLHEAEASCLPNPSLKEWPCLGMPTTHTPSSFFSSQTLFTPWPASFLPPSQSLLLISVSWNLGLKLNYNNAANTKSYRKKIQRNLTTTKKIH